MSLPNWLIEFANKELTKIAAKAYLYHYAPKEARDSIENDGLKTPYSLMNTEYKKEFIEKYRDRTAETLDKPKNKVTSKDVLKGLEIRRHTMFDGEGGSRALSAFIEPIPTDIKGMNKELKAFAEENDLYQIDFNKAVKDGIIEKAAIVEEKPRSERPVELKDVLKELIDSKIQEEQWKEKGKFYFSGKAHVMVVLKNGILPSKYIKLVNPEED